MTKKEVNIFISYAHKDDFGEIVEVFRKLLIKAFEAQGYVAKVFLDTTRYEKEPNYDHTDFEELIRPALDSADFFVAFVGHNYLVNSYTADEYEIFRDRERKISGLRNRIVVIRLMSEQALSSEVYKRFILNDIHTRSHMNWTSNRTATKDELRKPVLEICESILRSLEKPAPSQQRVQRRRPAKGEIPDRAKGLIDRLSRSVAASDKHSRFRPEIIAEILENVVEEIDSLNKDKYACDISLNKSFITRAKPIFREAHEIYAVSVDSHSSFWTSERIRKQAEEYTAIQPPKTYRIFVFSTAGTLLEHRWVMAAHHRQYGAHGRVLFTTAEAWTRFLHSLKDEQGSEQLSFLSQPLGSDFGILLYNFLNKNVYLAELEDAELRFRSIEVTSVHQRLMEAFKKKDEVGEVTLDDSADNKALVWREEYGRAGSDESDKRWFEAVETLFDSYDVTGKGSTSLIAHVVLFSRDIEQSDRFPDEMHREMSRLRAIGESDRKLVEAIWFGGIDGVKHNAQPVDALHHQKLLTKNSLTERWSHCLITFFRSQGNLTTYYQAPEHGRVRKKIYRLFSKEIRDIYDQLDDRSNPVPEHIRPILAATAEQIASRFMRRLDFGMPTTYEMFRLIEAPSFADEGSRHGTHTSSDDAGHGANKFAEKATLKRKRSARGGQGVGKQVRK